MLFPPQVNLLRRRLAGGGKAGQIEGLEFARAESPAVDLGRVVASEAPADVMFRTPEFIVGKPEDPSCLDDAVEPAVLRVPEKAIRVFADARIVGWRSLFARGGFYSSARWFLDAGGDVLPLARSMYEGLVVDDRSITYVAGPDHPARIRGNTLFLSAIEPGNHGSLLIRILPKLLYFAEQGIRIDQVVVPVKTLALVEAIGMARFGGLPLYSVREALPLEFESVYVVDDFDLKGAMCAKTMSRLRSLSPGSTGAGRIYVSRRLNAHRPMHRPLLNEGEVERAAKRMGFEVVFPEALSFRKQIELFANADFVVGPSGSGMINSLFSDPGRKIIDIESFHSTVRQHARIYSNGGHRYAFVFGLFDPNDGREARHSRRWTVPAGLVIEGIERLQAG